MDGALDSPARTARAAGRILRTAQVNGRDPDAASQIREALGAEPMALLALFVTPDADFDTLLAGVASAWPDTPLIACTTAGELGRNGYETGEIVAVAFPAADFYIETLEIPDLAQIEDQVLIDAVIQTRTTLSERAPEAWSEFAFLMVDGLSLAEERLTTLLATGLGSMPLFGGSSGDGTRFAETQIHFGGAARRNAAVVALVRSRAPVKVFTLDHLEPTETRMVVTGARPEERIVTEINAEPAAAEYARLLGKDPHQLDPFIFAAHPVVVRLGDVHHVRAIQRVNDAGELVFFSAINEGMVLTLADHADIAEHLEDRLGAMQEDGAPVEILACDCILRRIEAEQSQKARAISEILRRHNVTGFSTYGEQIGALHVNQTLTGVAFFRPEDDTN